MEGRGRVGRVGWRASWEGWRTDGELGGVGWRV